MNRPCAEAISSATGASRIFVSHLNREPVIKKEPMVALLTVAVIDLAPSCNSERASGYEGKTHVKDAR